MKINILIMSACLLFMASACTVNKRAHRPGYNVEWHSANQKPQKHPKLEEQEETNDLPFSEIKGIDVSSSLQGTDMSLNNEFGTVEELIASGSPITGISIEPIRVNHKSSSNSNISMEYQKEFAPIVSKEKSKPDRLATTGFWLVIFGMVYLFIWGLSSFAYYGGTYPIWFTLLSFVGILALFAGWVLCIVSIVKMMRNPADYKNKGLAIVGLIILALFVSVILLALL